MIQCIELWIKHGKRTMLINGCYIADEEPREPIDPKHQTVNASDLQTIRNQWWYDGRYDHENQPEISQILAINNVMQMNETEDKDDPTWQWCQARKKSAQELLIKGKPLQLNRMFNG